MIKWLIGITLLIFLVIVVSITTRQNSNATPPKITITESPTRIQELVVEGNEFTFNPKTLTVKKGQPVKITLKNTGSFPHNLVFQNLNAQTSIIQKGEETSVEFTPNETGQFPFVCTVDSHAEKGMQGTMIVQ